MIIAPLFLLVFGLGFAGMILLVRGVRGVPSLSEPRCAKCGYDLRGSAGAPAGVCPECGADLTKPRAVRWGDYRKRPKLIWTGAALLVLPAVVLAAMVFAFGRGGPLDHRASNAELIARLPRTGNQPWDWQELERRYAAGQLSNEEAAKAVDQLIASIAAQPAKAGGQPLTWSQEFVTRLDAAGVISAEQYLRLAQAFYGTRPTVRSSPRVRQGQWLRFSLDYAGHWDLPGVDVVKALRAVKTADGKELPVVSQSDHEAQRGAAEPNPDLLSYGGPFNIDGLVKLDLPPGEHTLTFVVDAAALPAGSTPRVVVDRPGQARRWPKARAKWTVEAPVKVTVVPEDQSPIEVVTSPALDPGSGIRVTSARVTRVGKGSRLTVQVDSGTPKVGLSFDVVLEVAGEEHPAGSYVVLSNRPSALETNKDLPPLPPDVKSIDVILRPNPKHAESFAGADRIWGGEIQLKNLPLIRYDLESSDTPPQ